MSETSKYSLFIDLIEVLTCRKMPTCNDDQRI